jgi:hypothetical protein
VVSPAALAYSVLSSAVIPALPGFTTSFAMSALFLAGCVFAGLLIPAGAQAPRPAALQPAASPDPHLPPGPPQSPGANAQASERSSD